MSEPVGIVGNGPFARALSSAAERAGRTVAVCPAWDDAPALERVVGETTLLILAVHADDLPPLASRLGELCDGRHALVHPLRGLVGDRLDPSSTVLRERTPVRKIGALGGRPSGGIVGSRFAEVGDRVRAALASASLRIYVTDDLVGVEVASCLMGVLAMGAGFARAAGVGPSASGVLLTRGVHEAARIGTLWSARAETFFGLAGFGDLLAAVADDDRPEVRLGRLLGGGMPLAQVASAVGGMPESVRIGTAVAQKAARAGVDTPIFRALGEIASGRPSGEAIAELMSHERIHEGKGLARRARYLRSPRLDFFSGPRISRRPSSMYRAANVKTVTTTARRISPRPAAIPMPIRRNRTAASTELWTLVRKRIAEPRPSKPKARAVDSPMTSTMTAAATDIRT